MGNDSPKGEKFVEAIFQSTFPRGERQSYKVTRLQINHFNPRSLVGNDSIGDKVDLKQTISIHVPSWGTTDGRLKDDNLKTFQSTFPRGERLKFSRKMSV